MEKHANHVWFFMVLISMSFVSQSSAQQEGCRYRIITQTADRINAGSTARISLTLCKGQHDCFINVLNLAEYGDNGPNHAYFGRGSNDRFTITTRAECYDPCQMLVRHDNGGARPRWLVDYIDVQAFDNTGRLVSRTHWPFYQWVNRGATVTINRCPIRSENIQAQAQAHAHDTKAFASLLAQYAIA